MSRNLNVLVKCLITFLAISAMAVSAASAATGFTTAAGAAMAAQDLGNTKFTLTGQEVSCNQDILSGTAPGGSFTELKMTAVYNECTGIGFSAKIMGFGQYGEENPCYWQFHANGTLDLVCPSGDATIVAGTCIVHIPGQTGLSTVTYTTGSVGGVNDLTYDLNITAITVTHTDGFLCPFSGSGEVSAAAWHGQTTAHATASGFRVNYTDH